MGRKKMSGVDTTPEATETTNFRETMTPEEYVELAEKNIAEAYPVELEYDPLASNVENAETPSQGPSQTLMVNHDLTTLFLIARTILPYDFLNAILYGNFEDATSGDIEAAKEIVANANRDKEAFNAQFSDTGQLDEAVSTGDSTERTAFDGNGDSTEFEEGTPTLGSEATH